MIKKNLFHKTKASGSDFRILADEELYIVNGGTGSLESEGASEETPEVQCDSSDSGSNEDKLADLASQAVAATEAPAESAPTSEATTIDAQINAIQSSAGSDTNEAQTNAADSVLNSYTEGIDNRNESGDAAVSIEIGANANQRMNLSLDDMRATATGLAEKGSTLIVADKEKSTAGLKVIDNALQRALNQEASIGEIMNRLEFTSNNLTTASENLQSAESTYRDSDMAKEMTEFTKNNILMQSATAMLSQANQQNQGVLQLLQ